MESEHSEGAGLSAPPETELNEIQKEALRACLQRRPPLGDFIKNYSHLSLSEYGTRLIIPKPKISEAFKYFSVTIAKKYLPQSEIANLQSTLDNVSAIDTASHGGVISEDGVLQSHLLISDGAKNCGTPLFLSLACGVVPMNNLTWPRGFYFEGQRVSLFSKSVDRLAFHECPALTLETLDARLKDSATPEGARPFVEWMREIPNLFSHNFFYEQCVIINSALWNNFFRRDESDPVFLQLLLEEVTAKLAAHSFEQNDQIAKFLFNRTLAPDLIEELSGLPGTWNAQQTSGTFLFWHRSGDFRSASLFLREGKLAGKGIEIPFEREPIAAALHRGEIMPSVFLSLLYLVYHGVRPLGGYHQCWYLPQYIQRLRSIIRKHPLSDMEFLNLVSEEDLIQLSYGLGFFPSRKNPSQLAGLETYLEDDTAVSTSYDRMGEVTVGNSIRYTLRRWYTEIVPAQEQTISPELLTVPIS